MSSSGEEDQAVHGSSAPPAAAAQTVAMPHTGLGNCRLRGAQCACAAPAVAVPPVLMLRLLPRRPAAGRGLRISPPAPRPGVGGAQERTQAPTPPGTRQLTLRPLSFPAPSSPGLLAHPLAQRAPRLPAQPNFCWAVRLVVARLPGDRGERSRSNRAGGVGEAGARESGGQPEAHISASPARVRGRAAGADAAPGAEVQTSSRSSRG
ncbi:uncharacterized protein LOC118144960 [Callithrix jacchus]